MSAQKVIRVQQVARSNKREQNLSWLIDLPFPRTIDDFFGKKSKNIEMALVTRPGQCQTLSRRPGVRCFGLGAAEFYRTL